MVVEIFLIGTTTILIFLYLSWFLIVAIPRKGIKAGYYPDMSVIIPAYNEENNIEQTIKSVLSAMYPKKFEIIIVNDASKDGTASVVKKIMAKNKNIKLVTGKHQGKAKAVNLAMQHAGGSIIVVLDADTLIEKNSLVRIVGPFSDKKVAAVASTLRVRRSSNPLTWFQHFEYAMSSSWRYVVDKVNGLCIVPGFCAFRISALRSIGGFKGDTAVEDYDICLHLMKAGYKIDMAPQAVAYTKVPESFSGLIRQRIRWNRGTIQAIRKHSDLLLKRHAIGLYTMPTQLYWFLHAFIYLPIVLYQMIGGYFRYFVSYGNIASFAVFEYFFNWFTVFGMIGFIASVYVGTYPANAINILTIIIFLLSYAFATFSILKFSGINIYSIVALLFFFPYYITILVIYLFSMAYEIAAKDRGEKWEKSK